MNNHSDLNKIKQRNRRCPKCDWVMSASDFHFGSDICIVCVHHEERKAAEEIEPNWNPLRRSLAALQETRAAIKTYKQKIKEINKKYDN